jgi:Dipeptidyl aminopeptidases/acylaminoacyl-peptidases
MGTTSIAAALSGMLLVGGALATSASAQSAEPLPIETALAQPAFPPYAPVTLSPTGAWVAYTLQYPTLANRETVNSWFSPTGTPNTANGARIRITDTRTGRTIAVGDESASNWGPAWSPDGRSLAFYSDVDGRARLWVFEVGSGRVRRVSDATVRGHRAAAYPRWTPDGRSVVMPILPPGSPPPEAAPAVTSGAEASSSDSSNVRVLRADPANRYGGQFGRGRVMDNRSSLEADLALVNVDSGGVTTLAHGYWPLEYEVAPNGRFVTFTSEKAAILRPRWTVPYDVLVVALGSSKPAAPRLVAADAPLTYNARSVIWSPDGTSILYSTTDTAGHLEYFTADSGAWRPRRVATPGVASLESDLPTTFPLAMRWAEDGSAFYALSRNSVAAVAMPQGMVRSVARLPRGYEVMGFVGPWSRTTLRTDGDRSLVVAIRNDSTKRMGFARMDLVTGGCRILADMDRHLGERYYFAMDVAPDGRVVFLSDDSQRPRDLWIADAGFASPRQLTHVAPDMERVTFGETRLIDFTTASGSPRRAALLLPSGYQPGQRYPLVVYPYPLLSRSNDLNTFGLEGSGTENMQLLATRGFAVLAPDVPPFDWKDHMRDLVSIIERAVNRTIELGVADSARLGILGHSWGGYTALAAIAQTDRFGAAVMRGGYGDLTTMTASVQGTGFSTGLQVEELTLGVTVWEQPELYRKNSPLLLLDRVHTPLLIIHGEGESSVPIFLADQIFAGLQRLGREVEFARYPNENHTESRWTYAHQRDYLTRMIGWFETHLSSGRTVRPAGAPGRH